MRPPRVLLQTTIPFTEDDWNITRFSMLKDCLQQAGFDVTSRDKVSLLGVDESDFDEIWLLAVDIGDGMSAEECEAVTRFRRRGRGLLVARDHQDLGSSVCEIGDIGAANFFHSRNVDPDPSHRHRDDQDAPNIDWPNYHSGRNGQYQPVQTVGGDHPLLNRGDGSRIEWFPAHPHEGAISAPASNPCAHVIATGTSRATGAAFNLIVAFESDGKNGRGIAESSFHHFVDYNWDPRMGCPSFVTDPVADEVIRDPRRLEDVKTYVRNAATWLAERSAASAAR